MDTDIQAAHEALEMVKKENKRDKALVALPKLFEARRHIWLEVESAKGSSDDDASNEVMQNNILQAMQLDMLRARCFMEIHELPLARAYLDDKPSAYREATRLLVHRNLGDDRALYFHKSIPESDLRRYIAIEFWLNAQEDRLLQIVLANRHDFWNPELADENNIKAPDDNGPFAFLKRTQAPVEELPQVKALTHCELLIENHRRFLGFCAEVDSIERLGISQADLERQQEEALERAEINLAEHDDYVLLVDHESFDRLSA